MPGLFLPRSRPWLWATAAEGGLEPAPVSRFRGASPHRISSYALLGLTAFHAHGARLPTIRNVWSAAVSQAKSESDRLVCPNIYGLGWRTKPCGLPLRVP